MEFPIRDHCGKADDIGHYGQNAEKQAASTGEDQIAGFTDDWLLHAFVEMRDILEDVHDALGRGGDPALTDRSFWTVFGLSEAMPSSSLY